MLCYSVSFIVFICVPLCAFVQGAPTTRPPLCQTYGGSPCSFPFTYKGQRYTACTEEDSPNYAWCATGTTADLTVTSWHYCINPTCSLQDSTPPPDAPTNGSSFRAGNPGSAGTTRRPGSESAGGINTTQQCPTYAGLPCVFPFTYLGQRYTTCTQVDSPNYAWCATVTEADLTITSWNYCINPQAEACSRQDSTPPPVVPTNGSNFPTTRPPPLCQTRGGLPCVFPFTYLGQRYTTCTEANSSGHAWCATGTAADLTFTSWDNCINPLAEACSLQDSTPPPAAPTNGSNFRAGNPGSAGTTRRPGSESAGGINTTDQCPTYGGLPCVFPFTYLGQWYTTCTQVESPNYAWCATVTEADLTITSWNYCITPQAEACSHEDSTPPPVAPTNGSNFSAGSAGSAENAESSGSAESAEGSGSAGSAEGAESSGSAEGSGSDGGAKKPGSGNAGGISPTITTKSKQCPTFSGLPCVFPFTYKDHLYTNCTREHNGFSNLPWCATATLNLVVTSWCYCSEPQAEACSRQDLIRL
ncbi:protein Gawky-like [Oscarella lobularis]|uniref:protein Gawky-like n=1 Tax=Oscarella lobularis TaxID=121494 RepID=UPI003313DD13